MTSITYERATAKHRKVERTANSTRKTALRVGAAVLSAVAAFGVGLKTLANAESAAAARAAAATQKEIQAPVKSLMIEVDRAAVAARQADPADNPLTNLSPIAVKIQNSKTGSYVIMGRNSDGSPDAGAPLASVTNQSLDNPGKPASSIQLTLNAPNSEPSSHASGWAAAMTGIETAGDGGSTVLDLDTGHANGQSPAQLVGEMDSQWRESIHTVWDAGA